MLRFDANGAAAVPAPHVSLPPLWLATFALSSLLAVFLAYAGPGKRYNSPFTDIEWSMTAEGPWSRQAWWTINHSAGQRWFRAQVDGAHDETTALVLSGAFSASAYVNGAYAGGKGSPGAAAAEEEPGPIDALVPIGPLLADGDNEVVVQVSSHHAGYRPGRLFHDFDLAGASPDPRRSLQQYAVATMLAGLLGGFCLLFVVAARRRDVPAFVWLAVAAGAALLALGAEVSRAFINYPYPWHGTRLFAVWAGLIAAGAALNVFAVVGFGGRARAALIGGAFAVAALFLFPGADDRAAVGLGCLFLGAAFALLQARDERRLAAALAAALAPWVWLAAERPTLFLDNSAYAAFALVFVMLAPKVFSSRESATRAPSAPEPMAAGPAMSAPEPALGLGETVAPIPARSIRRIHAAGNYAEIEFADGRRTLARAALSTLSAPAPLMRVHRSHIVNLDRATRLRRTAEGRHVLALDNGDTAPVSRGLVKTVRAALDARSGGDLAGPNSLQESAHPR